MDGEDPVGGKAQNPQYHIEASLDYNARRLVVAERVSYPNPFGHSISRVLLIVEPNRSPGTYTQTRLERVGEGSIQSALLDENLLEVQLDGPLEPQGTLELIVEYELSIPYQRQGLGFTGRQLNLHDWYPFVPCVRADLSWSASKPGIVGEHLCYDASDYFVDLQVSAPGLALTVASGIQPAADEAGYHFRLENARAFSLSLSPDFEVLREDQGPVTLLVYVFPEDINAGYAILETTAKAMEYYAEAFGPYPYASYTTVEGEVFDGFESSALAFVSQEYFEGYHGSPRGYSTIIPVHELAHQWWFNLVGNDPATEPWLDEAFATYSELLFYEHAFPDLAPWWWSFRVDSYQPSGWVNSTIYDHATFRSYVDAVYLRGARFLDELRDLVGDEAFFAFLRDHAHRHRFEEVRSSDVLQAFPGISETDLSPILREYFR